MRRRSHATTTTTALVVVLASGCVAVPAFSQAQSERRIEKLRVQGRHERTKRYERSQLRSFTDTFSESLVHRGLTSTPSRLKRICSSNSASITQPKRRSM